MYFGDAVALLGLEDAELTSDRVRRTYLRRLRDYPPERDPEGFRKLREAYEIVRAHAYDEEPDEAEQAAAPDAPEVSAPVAASAIVVEVRAPDVEVRPPDVEVRAPDVEVRAPDVEVRAPDVEPDNLFTPLPPLAERMPVREPVPLFLVVRNVLEALEIHDVATAKQHEADWLADPDASDFRSASTTDVARWQVTRELLGVAGELPARVLRHLAHGIQVDDLAGATPALEIFREAYPKEATAAHGLLYDRARSIFSQVEGSLWRPQDASPAQQKLVADLNEFARKRQQPLPDRLPDPQPQPQPYREPVRLPPPPRRNTGMGGIGAVVVILLAVLRVCATTASHTSSSSYDLSNLHIPAYDPHLLDNLNIDLKPPPDLSHFDVPPQLALPVPPDPNETQDALESNLIASTRVLARPDVSPSSHEAIRILDLEDAVLAHDCKKMLAKMPAAPAATPEALMTTDIEVTRDAHIVAVRARIQQWCKPPKGKAKAKPPAQPKTPPP